jgi:P pilus assembly chaperone PapD
MRGSKSRYAVIVAVVVALTALPEVVSAVLVAPHAVFMSHTNRTGEITLLNTGDEPEEVSIDLEFGYPASDSAGNVYVHLEENPGPDAPSAAGWVRAFPRRVRLAPGTRQLVRLFATPPADLPDGEYWSRVLVTSRGGVVPVTSQTENVVAGLTLEIRTIISLTYRKGDVHTGVELQDLTMAIQGDSLVAWVGLQRTGNAAFLGQVRFDVHDVTADTAVATFNTPLAVYYDLHRRYAFPLEGVRPGVYTLSFTLDTDRDDFDDLSNILPADPIRRVLRVEVAAR